MTEPVYRVGSKLLRTIYRNDQLIGIMDTAEDATLVVEALNRPSHKPNLQALQAALKRITEERPIR